MGKDISGGNIRIMVSCEPAAFCWYTLKMEQQSNVMLDGKR